MYFLQLFILFQILVRGNGNEFKVEYAIREIQKNHKRKVTHTQIAIGIRKWLNPNGSLEKWANKVATKTVDELKAEFTLPKREMLQIIKAPFTKLFGYKIINIKDAGKEKLICTQGPQENKIADFWRMIVEENISGIVMVTDTVEGGKKKCAQYWPLDKNDKKPLSFGGYSIKIVDKGKMSHIDNIVQTVLKITAPKNVEHKVSHFHWVGFGWPYHGAPNDPIFPIMLWNSLDIMGQKRIAVHGSAGDGRSGTIAAIQMGKHLVKNGETLNIPELVKKFRKQWADSVQSVEQYLYIYNAFLGQAKLLAKSDKNFKIDHHEKIDQLMEQITKQIVKKP